MKPIKNLEDGGSYAIEALLRRLEQRPTKKENILQDAGEEGVKRFAISDAIQDYARDKYGGDQIALRDFKSDMMSLMTKYSEEEIYKSLMDGTFESLVEANDPFKSMFGDSPFGNSSTPFGDTPFGDNPFGDR